MVVGIGDSGIDTHLTMDHGKMFRYFVGLSVSVLGDGEVILVRDEQGATGLFREEQQGSWASFPIASGVDLDPGYWQDRFRIRSDGADRSAQASFPGDHQAGITPVILEITRSVVPGH